MPGSWEDALRFIEEDAVSKDSAAGQRNPGHKNCFPLQTLTIDNLPPVYQTNDVLKFVKLVSALTVRVAVNYVSEKRPETVPGTDIPYPWCRDGGSNRVRVGNGWIEAAEINDDVNCRCKECSNSKRPKRELACISIKTAAHLVYDELETEHTTCHLSFDSEETPEVCKDVVLTGMNASFDMEQDYCTMECFTHDRNLVLKLRDLIHQHSLYLHSLNRDPVETAAYVKQNGGQNAKQETPLYVMVFHHEGSSKRISLGCYDNPGDADTEENQFPQTKLCPGSSGAPVITLGWHLVYPVCE